MSVSEDGERARISRRNLLKTGVAAGVAAPLAGVCNCGISTAFAAEAVELTTLRRTIVPGDYLTKGKRYRKLAQDNGWPIVVREDIAVAGSGRETKRTALVAFAHVTDLHVIDAASPSHPAFLAQYPGGFGGAPFSNCSRPQEALTIYVLDAMIRRINAIGKGPISARELDFAISTGDNADSRARHELKSTIDVMNGVAAVFNAAYRPDKEPETFQDTVRTQAYDAFWHPDPVTDGEPADLWKRAYGYPEIPEFMARVGRYLWTEGFAMPWYTGFGNHDLVDMGVAPDGSGPAMMLDILAVGPYLPVGLPATYNAYTFAEALEACKTRDDVQALINKMPMRIVTASNERRPFTRQDFVKMHLGDKQMGRAGPVGHGFTESNYGGGTAYYTFKMADGVVGIMLDSTNPYGGQHGSLDRKQAGWLEAELQSVHSQYFVGPTGPTAKTSNTDQWVVIFSHHNSQTFDNVAGPDGRPAADRMGSAEFVDLLGRYPNVVMWVNGHTHCNRVWDHPMIHGASHGFWEVNTAAHIDYPQQARIVEILDNGDRTLSVFGVMVDHSDASAVTRGGTQTRTSLAALSLEAAINDPSLDRAYRLGLPEDLNVELLFDKPSWR